MLVASLVLVVGRARTASPSEEVCFADEPDGLCLLQSGPGLRTQRVVSLLQTSGPDESSHDSVESTDNNKAEAVPPGVGASPEPRSHGAVTIVMPQKTIRDGIVLATSRQNATLRDDESRLGGHVDNDGESGKPQDDQEDHVESSHKEEIVDDNQNAHEDAHVDEDSTHLSVGEPDDAVDESASTAHTPDIFDIPSEKCQKPCLNGICHDGECFCRYPFAGLHCEIVPITEIGEVLAFTMLTCLALFTALIVCIVYRANQKTSAAAPVQEPHMADEEWLPPPPDPPP